MKEPFATRLQFCVQSRKQSLAANAGGAPGSAMPQAATMHVRRVNVVVHAITKSAVEFAMLREEDVREEEQRARRTGGASPPTL